MNIFVGPNARGKTTILESLALITSLKSFRTSKNLELIQNGKTEASVTIKLYTPTASKIVLAIEAHRKAIKMDEKQITPRSKFPFLGSSVSFGPDDLYLIKGGPDGRRDFLDELSIGLDPSVLKIIQRFERVLKQRNKLLNLIKNGGSCFEEYSIWTKEFLDAAIPLYKERFKTVSILNEKLNKIFKDLFQINESVSVTYKHSLSTEDDVAGALSEKIDQLSDAEKAVGYTLVGPHRDDLIFKIDQMEARDYASQGQIRGIVIALKVAQLELTRDHRNWSPILLLDDIISELDDQRVEALVEYLSNYPGQLFVTTAEVNKVKALHSKFSGFKLVDLGAQKLKILRPENAPERPLQFSVEQV